MSQYDIMQAACRADEVSSSIFHAMNVEVHGFAHSPFCIAIETVLESLEVPFERREVSVADRSSVLRLTGGACYEVPVLVHRDEVVFESGADSQDVARYIDSTFAMGSLFPERLKGIHDLVVRYLEHEVEGVTFRAYDPFHVDSVENVAERGMIVRHKERRFGRGCVERWKEERKQILCESAELLRPFEEMLSENGYLFGDRPVYADFLLGGILGNLLFGGHNRLPADLGRLAALPQRLQAFRDGGA